MSSLLSGTIESLTLEGEGVTRVDGKVYFVNGGLPGENVEFEVKRNRRKHGHAKLRKIIEAANDSGRVESDCEYFGVCGGCSMRHYQQDRQLEAKQRALLDAFERIGKVAPENVMPPLSGEWLHYRRKARLGIRYVEKKGGALVGFREKNNSFITALDKCLTLTKPISDLLPDLTQLVNKLSVKQKLPQIEVAQGDNQISLVFRHLEPLTDADQSLLLEFSKVNQIQSYLQPKGLDSIRPLYPQQPEELFYELEKFGLKFYFAPTDFIQVNAQANQLLINKTIELLDISSSDKILDLYCGLGNFSLPIVQQCDYVLGVEGDRHLVEKARRNAEANNLSNIDFDLKDLSDEGADFTWLNRKFSKVLLDPARSGAVLICQKLTKLKPAKIVYVSCNPATLARDAELLVHHGGYKLRQAGIVNMFPHTAHIESIAVFEQ